MLAEPLVRIVKTNLRFVEAKRYDATGSRIENTVEILDAEPLVSLESF